MAIKQNTLIPVLGILALLIVGTILYLQVTSDGSVPSANTLQQVPQPSALPAERGADSDNASETLATVVASNAELRRDVAQIIERNRRLEEENRRLAAAGVTSARPSPPGSTGASPPGGVDQAMDTAGRAAEAFLGGMRQAPPAPGSQLGRVVNAAPVIGEMALETVEDRPGAVAYKTMPPLGYATFEDTRNAGQGPAQRRYVRTTATAASDAPSARGAAPAAHAVQPPQDEAYFTLPENATLVGVKAMTSIIGRVPIDGRVTDPMQFKAIVGRENLAANGWELPDDLAGMIVTGVAIGDMALSCSEGKIRSATFVFNDGTIRTVSNRSRSGGSGNSGDLGFISDRHGNPCIMGRFVTNAPAYLTDIIGAKTLGVASQAFADAARLVTQRPDGSTTNQIMDTERYVMGQAVAGATDEFTNWLLSRLKNSFDAVVTPAGHELVVHLDQELRIDKAVDARRIAHRAQTSPNTARGGFYGLE